MRWKAEEQPPEGRERPLREACTGRGVAAALARPRPGLAVPRRSETPSPCRITNERRHRRSRQKQRERAYTKLTPSQQTVARQVFLRLTTTTADSVDTADRVSRDDLVKGQKSPATDQDVETVLEAFAAERLLTLGSRTVEISHEVLLTAWPLLQEWLAETRADRAVRSRIHNAASEWIGYNHDSSYLYRGTLLDLATETVDRLDADPTRQPSLIKVIEISWTPAFGPAVEQRAVGAPSLHHSLSWSSPSAWSLS